MTTPDRFRDCTTDPGPLTGVAAVHAMSLHYACPPRCKHRWRALAAIETEYTENPEQIWRAVDDDTAFADLLREAVRALQDASGHH